MKSSSLLTAVALVLVVFGTVQCSAASHKDGASVAPVTSTNSFLLEESVDADSMIEQRASTNVNSNVAHKGFFNKAWKKIKKAGKRIAKHVSKHVTKPLADVLGDKLHVIAGPFADVAKNLVAHAHDKYRKFNQIRKMLKCRKHLNGAGKKTVCIPACLRNLKGGGFLPHNWEDIQARIPTCKAGEKPCMPSYLNFEFPHSAKLFKMHIERCQECHTGRPAVCIPHVLRNIKFPADIKQHVPVCDECTTLCRPGNVKPLSDLPKTIKIKSCPPQDRKMCASPNQHIKGFKSKTIHQESNGDTIALKPIKARKGAPPVPPTAKPETSKPVRSVAATGQRRRRRSFLEEMSMAGKIQQSSAFCAPIHYRYFATVKKWMPACSNACTSLCLPAYVVREKIPALGKHLNLKQIPECTKSHLVTSQAFCIPKAISPIAIKMLPAFAIMITKMACKAHQEPCVPDLLKSVATMLPPFVNFASCPAENAKCPEMKHALCVPKSLSNLIEAVPALKAFNLGVCPACTRACLPKGLKVPLPMGIKLPECPIVKVTPKKQVKQVAPVLPSVSSQQMALASNPGQLPPKVVETNVFKRLPIKAPLYEKGFESPNHKVGAATSTHPQPILQQQPQQQQQQQQMPQVPQ